MFLCVLFYFVVTLSFFYFAPAPDLFHLGLFSAYVSFVSLSVRSWFHGVMFGFLVPLCSLCF